MNVFLCPRLPKAGMGGIAFPRDVTWVCHIHNQSLTSVTVYIQVYMQVYLHIHIYFQVVHNFDTF